jgi:hypothetical protein
MARANKNSVVAVLPGLLNRFWRSQFTQPLVAVGDGRGAIGVKV